MTTTFTLTGSIAEAIGQPATGRNVILTWSTNLGEAALVDLDNDVTYPPRPVRIPVGDDGTFAVTLIATNSTGTNVPDGSLRYTISAQYWSANGARLTWEVRNFQLTANTDLADLVETADPPATQANIYLAQMQVMLDEAEELVGLTGEDAAVAALVANEASSTRASLARIKQWAKVPDSIITGSITRNSAGVVTSAAVVWPDGATGVFTATTIGSLDTIDAYTITYDDGPTELTFTQPLITRDTSGAATNVPAMVVS